MNESEMPIFSKTFDMLTWLIPAVQHFPRANRHDFTHRMLRPSNRKTFGASASR